MSAFFFESHQEEQHSLNSQLKKKSVWFIATIRKTSRLTIETMRERISA